MELLQLPIQLQSPRLGQPPYRVTLGALDILELSTKILGNIDLGVRKYIQIISNGPRIVYKAFLGLDPPSIWVDTGTSVIGV